MSLKWMLWALEQKVGNPGAKFVLMKLGDNTNERSNVCWPSIKEIAEQTELGIRSVQRHLDYLCSKGLIESASARNTSDGSPTSNYYYLDPKNQTARATPRKGVVAGGGAKNGDQNANLAPGEVSQWPTNLESRTRKEPGIEPPAPNGAAKPKGLSKPKTTIGDYSPGDGARERATKYWEDHGRQDLSADEEAERFMAHHRSRGSRMVDWDAAWQTWYCNALQFNKPGPNGHGPNGAGTPEPDSKEWQHRLRCYYGYFSEDDEEPLPKGFWIKTWGPPPHDPKNRVPKDAYSAVKPRMGA